MNNTQTSVKDNPYQYRVICERCHKTLFYSGQENGETISVLCDKCTEAVIER
ncbi:hypothetical protein [Desulfosporosinus sp.]|uniref:hypothetical protein n=1 Tax=Desulfosporosinus sp. TaxID=157907 RepID=UPI0025B8526D|nr:hypothetical protein [Desulfosporosinus sp.]MBC2728560.1 hypothetical protein [Desulfosporosinus sp.]